MTVEEAPVKPGGSRAQLYTWQTWVHVGPEAENCPDVNEEDGTVECHDPLHFHAWVRLPNQHQHGDIREKALAAKARRMRLMREVGSDLNVILEEQVEQVGRRGEEAREELTADLVNREWWKYWLEAQRALQFQRENPEDDESPLVWEHIDDDKQRLRELRLLHADEQPQDEIAMLERRLAEYDKAFEERRAEAERPFRDELAQLDISALVERWKDAQVEAEGSSTFDDTFADWRAVTCCYRSVEGAEHWAEPSQLRAVPDQISDAIRDALASLDREKGGLRQGNS